MLFLFSQLGKEKQNVVIDDEQRREQRRLDAEQRRHIKQFEKLYPLSIRALSRSARLPYLRVRRYIVCGPVRFTADERRKLGAALDRQEEFRRLDKFAKSAKSA